MHIMIVADGRSPITQNWVRGLLALNHRVTLVSTFPCAHLEGTLATHVLPVAFSSMGGTQAGFGGRYKSQRGRLRQAVASYRGMFQSFRSFLGPLTLSQFAGRFKALVNEYQPDLVHALRIPYEGMLAAYTPSEIPLVISIWGNDLTLHAVSSPFMRQLTQHVMHRANGLIVDVRRDLRLSYQWGFNPEFPNLVVPTCGGIDLIEIGKIRQTGADTFGDRLPVGVPLVVNPRGLRPGYVRNDTFFHAIRLFLERRQDAVFVCPSMQGQPEAMRWLQKLGIENNVVLLPYLTQNQLWELFLRAVVSVSITVHDGTPNTLLEAMACGSFPIVGDIESLREWIIPGVNGMLVEPDQPQALCEALLLALESNELRSAAAEYNLDLVTRRGEVNLIRSQVEVFYQRVLAAFAAQS